MRSADLDTLFIAGLNGSGPDHWQTRWRRRMPNARLVEQADWDKPEREAWIDAIVAACQAAERPILLIAHSLGVIALAHAAKRLQAREVKGAFLVSPPSDDALSAVARPISRRPPSRPCPFHRSWSPAATIPMAISRTPSARRRLGARACTMRARPAISMSRAVMVLGRKARCGSRASSSTCNAAARTPRKRPPRRAALQPIRDCDVPPYRE